MTGDREPKKFLFVPPKQEPMRLPGYATFMLDRSTGNDAFDENKRSAVTAADKAKPILL